MCRVMLSMTRQSQIQHWEGGRRTWAKMLHISQACSQPYKEGGLMSCEGTSCLHTEAVQQLINHWNCRFYFYFFFPWSISVISRGSCTNFVICNEFTHLILLLCTTQDWSIFWSLPWLTAIYHALVVVCDNTGKLHLQKFNQTPWPPPTPTAYRPACIYSYRFWGEVVHLVGWRDTTGICNIATGPPPRVRLIIQGK